MLLALRSDFHPLRNTKKIDIRRLWLFMEKKILWGISIILILILWIKAGPFKEDGNSLSESSELYSDATEDEKKYYKLNPIKTSPPDFAAIADVNERKDAFFSYLTPFINEKNTLILKDRARLVALKNSSKKMSTKDIKWISKLRQDYRLEKRDTYSKEDINELLNRVDIIPVSLVLAQAANESAWGMSRFATEGNNYFGQWCFRKGCGLVPLSRDSDAAHEVRKFKDPRESVFAYVDNLNTNNAYRELRATRLALRNSDQDITGLALVGDLQRYSERGQDYVEEIAGLINYNQLWRFNRYQTSPEI